MLLQENNQRQMHVIVQTDTKGTIRIDLSSRISETLRFYDARIPLSDVNLELHRHNPKAQPEDRGSSGSFLNAGDDGRRGAMRRPGLRRASVQ